MPASAQVSGREQLVARFLEQIAAQLLVKLGRVGDAGPSVGGCAEAVEPDREEVTGLAGYGGLVLVAIAYPAGY